MNDDLNAERVAELRALLAKCSPLPWEGSEGEIDSANGGAVARVIDYASIKTAHAAGEFYSHADEALIVAAVNGLGALLALAERALAEARKPASEDREALWLEYVQLLVSEVGRLFGIAYAHGMRSDPESVQRGIELRARLGLDDNNQPIAAAGAGRGGWLMGLTVCQPLEQQELIERAEAEAGLHPWLYVMGWRAAEKHHGILVECANCEAAIAPGEGFGTGTADPPGTVCSRDCFIAYQAAHAAPAARSGEAKR